MSQTEIHYYLSNWSKHRLGVGSRRSLRHWMQDHIDTSVRTLLHNFGASSFIPHFDSSQNEAAPSRAALYVFKQGSRVYFALLRLTFVFYDLHRKPRAPFELLADKVVDTEELTSAFITFSDVNDCLMLRKHVVL